MSPCVLLRVQPIIFDFITLVIFEEKSKLQGFSSCKLLLHFIPSSHFAVQIFYEVFFSPIHSTYFSSLWLRDKFQKRSLKPPQHFTSTKSSKRKSLFQAFVSCTVPAFRCLFVAFAKLRKATISFVTSVCPSAWNNSAPTGLILMKFDI
jgi:hypothetical protein